MLAYAPRLDDDRLASLVRGARAALLPVRLGQHRPGRDRGDRLRHAGRRIGRRGAAGDRRGGRDPRRAARPGAPRPGPRHGVRRRPRPRRPRRDRAGSARRPTGGRGPTWPARRARSTPRRPRALSVGRVTERASVSSSPSRAGSGGGGGAPGVIVTFVPVCMTWTNVWPTVSLTALPLASKKSVGFVRESFRHVPLIVVPFVEIQAVPLPTTSCLEAVLRRAVVERPELHQHDHDVLRGDAGAGRRVDLLLLAGDRPQVRVRSSSRSRSGSCWPSSRRRSGRRGAGTTRWRSGPNVQAGFIGPSVALTRLGEAPEVLAVRVEVVRREAGP